MTICEFTDELLALPTQRMGGDHTVIAAARVSTIGVQSLEALELDPGEGAGLIRFLMANRHGTPFEHNAFTFYVSAPIFVFREFQRHRIGFSYNEESGRYKQLEPKFYLPPVHRPLVQVGKTGAYRFEPGDAEQYNGLLTGLMQSCGIAYDIYEEQLEAGIAKEVARMALPVNIYSSMHVTCNARSLMAFLQLRTNHPEATFPSKPMWEIQKIADLMEAEFAVAMPITYAAWVAAGRVAP